MSFIVGFGLFITKGIVDLHHGEIHVFSKGEVTGCTFIVDLPMTRKINPIGPVNHMRRRSTRDRIADIAGLLGGQGGQNSHRHRPTSPAHIHAPQDANTRAALNSRQSMNHRLTSNMANDDRGSLSNLSNGARLDSNPPNQEEVRSLDAVINSAGRQSLRDLTEHDRTTTSAARQAKATALLRKQSTNDHSFPIRNPEGADASGPTMSPPLLRGEHARHDAAVAVGPDHAADAPSQQLRPAAMTIVTSSPVPAPVPAQQLAPLSSGAPASSLSAASSPRSQRLSQNGQLPPQGPVYHVLVVDDSTMTRKMLLKTLRNEGLTHPLNILNTISTQLFKIPLN